MNNPSVIIDTIEIPAEEFNRVLRDAPIIPLDDVHAISWQVTIDNNLLYANPNGDAVLRIYNQDLSGTEFIEIGMGHNLITNYGLQLKLQRKDTL